MSEDKGLFSTDSGKFERIIELLKRYLREDVSLDLIPGHPVSMMDWIEYCENTNQIGLLIYILFQTSGKQGKDDYPNLCTCGNCSTVDDQDYLVQSRHILELAGVA